MSLPYRIATLLYLFNPRDEVLLLERAREPNLGLWSPPGGKLRTADGESPHACAAREAQEETGWNLSSRELRLVGIVSEHGYAGQAHWLMFLFEARVAAFGPPPDHCEGRFAFWDRASLDRLPMPQTDREQIWPWFWRYRGGFFVAHCHCHPGGANAWTCHQSEVSGGSARAQIG